MKRLLLIMGLLVMGSRAIYSQWQEKQETLEIPGSFFSTKVDVKTLGNTTYLSFICDYNSAIKAVSIFAKKHPEIVITMWRMEREFLCLQHLSQHSHGVFVEHQPKTP